MAQRSSPPNHEKDDLLTFYPSSTQSAGELLKILVEDPKYNFVFGLGEFQGSSSLDNSEQESPENYRELRVGNQNEENDSDENYSIEGYQLIHLQNDDENSEQSESEVEPCRSSAHVIHGMGMIDDLINFETIEDANRDDDNTSESTNENIEDYEEEDGVGEEEVEEILVEFEGGGEQAYEIEYRNSYMKTENESKQEAELLLDIEYDETDKGIEKNNEESAYENDEEDDDHGYYDLEDDGDNGAYENDNYEELFLNNDNDYDKGDEDEDEDEDYDELEVRREVEVVVLENVVENKSDEETEEDEQDKEENDNEDNETETETENENENDYDADAYDQFFPCSPFSTDQLELNEIYFDADTADEEDECELVALAENNNNNNNNQAPQPHYSHRTHSQSDQRQHLRDDEHGYDDGDDNENEENEHGENDWQYDDEEVELINITEDDESNSFMDYYNENDDDFEYFDDPSYSNGDITFPYQDGMTIEEMANFMTSTI